MPQFRGTEKIKSLDAAFLGVIDSLRRNGFPLENNDVEVTGCVVGFIGGNVDRQHGGDLN
jgi:hypothetical protein